MCSISKLLFHEIYEMIDCDLLIIIFLQDILQPLRMLQFYHHFEAVQLLASSLFLKLPSELLVSGFLCEN